MSESLGKFDVRITTWGPLGIIHSLRSKSFPKNWNLLPPNVHTYVCVSGSKKCLFFGKSCVSIKWMISKKYAALLSCFKKYMKFNSTLTIWKYNLFFYAVKPPNVTPATLHQAYTFSKSTVETLEQRVESVQS